MADNIGYTPGAGATIAADDIGGNLHQRIKIVLGPDGTADGDVSSSNPMPVMAQGELVEVLASLRTVIGSLSRNVGQTYPDVAGRLRVAVDSISGALTLATITTVGTVTTVATVTNQTNIGGYAASDKIPSLLHMGAETLRRNISVT